MEHEKESDTPVRIEGPITPQLHPTNSLVPARDLSLADCPTNLDLTTLSGKAMALACGNPSDLDFGDRGHVSICAHYWLIFPDVGVDPNTGEYHEFTRTCLIDEEGSVYRTTSSYAPGRLKAVLSLFSPVDWSKGIWFRIAERKSRKTGRTYHDIRVLTSAPEYE